MKNLVIAGFLCFFASFAFAQDNQTEGYSRVETYVNEPVDAGRNFNGEKTRSFTVTDGVAEDNNLIRKGRIGQESVVKPIPERKYENVYIDSRINEGIAEENNFRRKRIGHESVVQFEETKDRRSKVVRGRAEDDNFERKGKIGIDAVVKRR